MSRIHPKNPIDPQVSEVLTGMKQALGFTPNIFQLMGHSKAFFGGFLTLSKSLEHGLLSPQTRESIALAVAGFNGCKYCTAAHSKIGAKAHLDEEEIRLNLEGKSGHPKTQAALDFVHKVLKTKGHIQDADIQHILENGWNEEQLLEIMGNVAVNMTTNYFNNTFLPKVDF